MATNPPHKVTVVVTERGVSIDCASKHVSMSRFSDRAKRLINDFGVGTHVIVTDQDVADLPTGVWDDIVAALS